MAILNQTSAMFQWLASSSGPDLSLLPVEPARFVADLEQRFGLLWIPAPWQSPWALFGITAIVLIFLEVLSYSVPLFLESFAPGRLTKLMPGGRLLQRLEERDYFYIIWNKFVTTCFLCHYVQWLMHGGQHIVLDCSVSAMTWVNMLVPIPLSYLVYDLMYAPFHRLLHWQPLYPYASAFNF